MKEKKTRKLNICLTWCTEKLKREAWNSVTSRNINCVADTDAHVTRQAFAREAG